MGYMTTIMFLNDSYGDIKNNPEQVTKNILDAMDNMDEPSKVFSIGSFSNPMKAYRSAHADVPRLYFTHQNSMNELGSNQNFNNMEYRKKILEQAKLIIKEEQRLLEKVEDRLKLPEYNNLVDDAVQHFVGYKISPQNNIDYYGRKHLVIIHSPETLKSVFITTSSLTAKKGYELWFGIEGEFHAEDKYSLDEKGKMFTHIENFLNTED